MQRVHDVCFKKHAHVNVAATHSSNLPPPRAPNMAKRVKVVSEPFKLSGFPIQSLTLQNDVNVRCPSFLTEGNGAATVPDAADAYEHYTPILTDVDRRPYINLTPAKEDWLRTPYGIDPTRASTMMDKNGIPRCCALPLKQMTHASVYSQPWTRRSNRN